MRDHDDGSIETPITIPSPPPRDSKDDPTSEIEIPKLACKSSGGNGQQLQPCLVILSGLDMGRVIPVAEQGMLVGRGDACQLMLRDDAISRQHIEIRREGDERVVVRDLSSTNGTFVAGRRIEQAELRDGDKLFLGRHTVLKFRVHDAIDLSYQNEMYKSSTRDLLTGAFNRRYFAQKMSADLSFGRRHGIPMSLLMLDIDYFKQVNDTYGHDVGDEVLRAFSTAVADSIRAEDVLARYGGEEFAIIAQGTGIDGGMALAERIRNRICSSTIETSAGPGARIKLTVSTGVASLKPGAKAEASLMITTADVNLYAAKKGGRDRVVATEVE
jgi:diguanylate cyclase (GGDEF)-like protein